MTSFDEYVRARGSALLRFAYLLCGDAHRAEDFVQEALLRCHRRWQRISREDPEAYVRKAVLRQYLSWRRLRMAGEILTDRVVDDGDPRQHQQPVEQDDTVRELLRLLPRRQRAVLVLRFYEDLPDSEIARLLDCSPATVRVHVHRGLARLRQQLGSWDVDSSLNQERAR